MKQKFRKEVVSLIDDAIERDLSKDKIEDILQKEAQNVRENRRVYRVFVYECPNSNCKKSASPQIDRMKVQCDICEEGVDLLESKPVDDSKRMKFCCEEHGTTRIHEFSHEEITCEIHNKRMELIESYHTEEGLGD